MALKAWFWVLALTFRSTSRWVRKPETSSPPRSLDYREPPRHEPGPGLRHQSVHAGGHGPALRIAAVEAPVGPAFMVQGDRSGPHAPAAQRASSSGLRSP